MVVGGWEHTLRWERYRDTLYEKDGGSMMCCKMDDGYRAYLIELYLRQN
jgi:hypothetical protein